MRTAAMGIGLSILLTWVSAATAEPVVAQSQRGSAETPTTTGWYGGGIVISDAATLATWATAISGAPALGYVGLVGYLVVPQVIHGLHRNGSGVALSLTTRIGAPLVFALVVHGMRGQNCSRDDPEQEDMCRQRGLPRLLVAGGLGMLTAMVLDAAVYARRPAAPRPRAFAIVPLVDWSKSEGWTLGARGQF